MTFGAGSYGSVVYGGVVSDVAAIVTTPFPLCLTVTAQTQYNIDITSKTQYNLAVTAKGGC
ncbi:MAG: hypothetical protein KAJ33_06100 [Thermoplasmata archaeon]|nr:hypothetical protein [Thermoplasmata archaeon]